MFLLKFENTGEIINENFVDNGDAINIYAYDIIEKKDNSGYYCLSRRTPPESGGLVNRVLNLNNNLGIINSRTLPTEISNEGNIKWFTDSSYITSGFRYLQDSRDISVLITDTLHEVFTNN